jgi:hypothetical protein
VPEDDVVVLEVALLLDSFAQPVAGVLVRVVV